jgi:hypothetical protein
MVVWWYVAGRRSKEPKVVAEEMRKNFFGVETPVRRADDVC